MNIVEDTCSLRRPRYAKGVFPSLKHPLPVVVPVPFRTWHALDQSGIGYWVQGHGLLTGVDLSC